MGPSGNATLNIKMGLVTLDMFKNSTKCSVMCLLIYGAVAYSASAQDIDDTKVLAELGNAQAQLLLGTMYDYGLGIPEDDGEALKWYRKAAEQGYADAQYKVGANYANGYGVNQNLIFSYQWLSLSAVQGDPDAKKAIKVVADLMTPNQITDAQKLSSVCFSNNYIGCD